MNLLLLLSALLSALGGAGSARAAQAPVALSSSVARAAQVAVDTRASIATRPVQIIAGPAHATMIMPAVLTLAAVVPAYWSRRRE